MSKILLVDDEPSIRVVLGAVLEEAGYAVEVAEDGASALRKFDAFGPDLLVTDLRMPNVNGFELLAAVRARFPQMPAIAISGEFVASEVHLDSLADAFFEKGSYSIPEFLARIEELLEAARLRLERRQLSSAAEAS